MENDLRHRLMLTGLHIWLVLVRLRREGDYGKDLSQVRKLRNAEIIEYE